MAFIRHLIIVGTTLLASSSVQASPTEHDFDICKKEALKLLELCLAQHHGNSNSIYQCWPDNEQNYGRCVQQILADYYPSAERIRAVREKEAAAKKAKAELEANRKKDNN